jgi:DNA-binding MarR family transcriptional regulator
MDPTDAEYQALLELRTGLRRFLRWSEHQARMVGLTPAQHQLLLAMKGHPDAKGPTIGDVADYLLLRHHSAVGLVDRAEKAGLLVRGRDPDNQSIVRLRLTAKGSKQLEALSELHLEELSHLAPTINALWDALEEAGHQEAPDARHPAARPSPARTAAPRNSPARRH